MTPSHEELRRKTDYADMPRSLIWALTFVKEVGIVGCTVLALLYICFFSINKLTESQNSNANKISEALSAVSHSVDKETDAVNALRRIVTHNKKYGDDVD